MVIIPTGSCDTCHLPMPWNAELFGPRMWHGHNWVCQHELTVTCPDCYPSDLSQCSVCGCQEEYT